MSRRAGLAKRPTAASTTTTARTRSRRGDSRAKRSLQEGWETGPSSFSTALRDAGNLLRRLHVHLEASCDDHQPADQQGPNDVPATGTRRLAPDGRRYARLRPAARRVGKGYISWGTFRVSPYH